VVFDTERRLRADAAHWLSLGGAVHPASRTKPLPSSGLRHSAATCQADAGNDIRFIQKSLRDASIETTAIGLLAEDDERHAETTAKHLAT
jgi:site-specific recombinase XerD